MIKVICKVEVEGHCARRETGVAALRHAIEKVGVCA